MDYIIHFFKKSFFLKFFIFNKKYKLNNLRALNSINFQKFIDSDYENYYSILYNTKLIENLSGNKPFINKIIFKSIIKKKKYILVFLQTFMYTDKNIKNFFFNLVYSIKLLPYINFENKKLNFSNKIYLKKNFVLLKLNNVFYLSFADSSKMLEYIYYNKKISNLSIIFFFKKKNEELHSKSFFNFLKIFLSCEKA